jgi:hypothetical protein
MAMNTGAARTTQRRLRSIAAPPDSIVAVGAAALDEALPALVRQLDETATWGQPPSLLRITPPARGSIADGFDLGVRPLDCGVVEFLAGFTAPPDWLAIGVITEGQAFALDGRREPAGRVRAVHLVARSGASAGLVRFQGEPPEPAPAVTEGQPGGRVDDACRRVLGLGTAPPERTTAELWALVWLDRVLATAASSSSASRWPAVAARHPAVALLQREDKALGDAAVSHLVRLGELLAEIHDWSALRVACAAGDWPVDDLPSSVAAWLDDGSFSRWVLGGFPAIAELSGAAAAVLRPSDARRVRAALRAWGLE